jgi:acyl carrier protein
MTTTDDAGRPSADDVFAVVRDAVAVVLERDPREIARETTFEELRADSLALVEMAEIVEERLAPVASAGFRIDDDDLERLVTVGDAVDYAVARL